MKANHRLAVARVYARAASSLFNRVATSLSNIGLSESRYQIIRNQIQQCGRSPIRQYRALLQLHHTITTP